jgi:hypothetical protein
VNGDDNDPPTVDGLMAAAGHDKGKAKPSRCPGKETKRGPKTGPLFVHANDNAAFNAGRLQNSRP